MDSALEILIVEDDFSFALDLEMIVEELGYTVLSTVDTAEEAHNVILTTPPDAILMDIDLKGEMTGLDLAEKIKGLQIPILFITSYQEQQKYDRANKLDMIGYLVKPLNQFTIFKALDACLSSWIPKNESSSKEEIIDNNGLINGALVVKKGNVYHKVKLAEIIYMSSEQEYVKLRTSGGNFLFRESLKSLENRLADLNFFRAHHSYLINLNLISNIDSSGGQVIMCNAEKIPVSRRRKKELASVWGMA